MKTIFECTSLQADKSSSGEKSVYKIKTSSIITFPKSYFGIEGI